MVISESSIDGHCIKEGAPADIQQQSSPKSFTGMPYLTQPAHNHIF